MSVVITPDANSREDFSNGVVLDGVIDASLVSRITPTILELRSRKAPRITVYINSDGGNLAEAEAIFNLLRFQGVDQYSPWIITVAVGNAKSAAANLLAQGDYSIAYPNASIHFHGVRFSEVPTLTMEDAAYYSEYLSGRNLDTALRLANDSLQRSVIHYATLKADFDSIRTAAYDPDLEDSECFFRLISQKLTTEPARRVVRKAIKHFRDNRELSQIALGAANKQNQRRTRKMSPAAYETAVLKAVAVHLTRKKEDREAGLTDAKLSEIVSAYKLLRDYHLGPHTKALKTVIKRFGVWFLNTTEGAHYTSLNSGPPESREKWLEATVWPKMKPFWYLVVAIWQALQEEENPISPADAYWLGVVDEVAGTDLCALRTAIETVHQVDVPANDTPTDLAQA
jgi:hypothetical protein